MCSYISVPTGYNQSVTGCGSQRRQCSCYSTKFNVNSMILILKLNMISMRNIFRWETYTLKVVFVEHHTQFNVDVSHRSQIQFEDEDHTLYISIRWVTTTCFRWEPQPVTLWLYQVMHCVVTAPGLVTGMVKHGKIHNIVCCFKCFKPCVRVLLSVLQTVLLLKVITM